MVINCKNGKNGQLGLVDVFSYILYFLSVIVIIFLLNIAGCVAKGKAEAAIGADVSLSSSVRADSQLNSYLRTKMPDKAELDKKLDWLEKNPSPQFANQLKKLNVNFGKAKDFFNKYPETYEGQDYSKFIAGLHAIYSAGVEGDKEGAEQAFKAATAAMFLRAVEDYPKKGEYLFYLLPVGVDFNPSDFNPFDKEDLCEEVELCAQLLPVEIIPNLEDPLIYIPPQRLSSQSVQVIPLADSTLAKVEFRYFPERESRLPKP